MLALWVVAGPAAAAPSAAVNRYGASEVPGDGFTLARPQQLGHLQLGARLHLDYANDPLVYEDSVGVTDSELLSLVSSQVTAHLSVALGLFDAATVFVALPVHLVMSGESLGNQPTATGFGPGDLALGGRLHLLGFAGGRIALQLTATAGTGEGGEGGRPGVAGDGSGTLHAELVGELAAGDVALLLSAGAFWRQDTHFSSVDFGDTLTYGAGAVLPLVDERLNAHVELEGQSPLNDLGARSGSPLEALAGLSLRLDDAFEVGLGGGAGLLRGYGSPDLRVIASASWQGRRPEPEEARPEPELEPEPTLAVEPEPEAPAPAIAAPERGVSSDDAALRDGDGDGVSDLDDRCAEIPGSADNRGCPVFIQIDPQSGEIILARGIDFESRGTEVRSRSVPVLEEIAALLTHDEAMRVRIESHLARQRRRRARPEQEAEVTVARAVAVARWLVARGLDPSRLEAYGCGTNRPKVPHNSRQSADNERITVYVVQPLPPSGMRSTRGCTEGVVAEPPPKALQRLEPAPPPAKPAPQPKPKPAPPPPPPPAKPAPQPKPAPPPEPAKPAEPATPTAAPAPAPSVPVIRLDIAPKAAPKPAAPPTTPAPTPAPSPPPPPAPKPAAAAAPTVAIAGAATTAAVAAALAADPGGDRDGDGVKNADDPCPLAPQGDGEKGCPVSHRVDLESGQLTLEKRIRFDDDSAALDRRSRPHLDEIAATLRANPEMKVLVLAHVPEGADAMALSVARADTVRQALTERKIAKERVQALGCGATRPIAPTNVPWGRKKNERVEIHLLDPAPATGVTSVEGCKPK